MYSPLYTACDLCATILEGKQGTANMDKPHLIIKGNIGWYNTAQKGEQQGRVIWAKRRDDNSDLHFCNEKCLIGFMEAKKELVQNHKNFSNDFQF